MKRFALPVAVLAVLAVVPSAGAVVFSIPDDADAAFDGSDVYWVSEGRSKKRTGPTATFKIIRGSTLDGSKRAIASFEDDGSFFHDVYAGGGKVSVVATTDELEMKDFFRIKQRQRLIRMSRDGTGLETLIDFTQTLKFQTQIYRGRGYLNDCNRNIEIAAMSSSGSVAVSDVRSERASPRCGRKRNVDRQQVYSIESDGSHHPIIDVAAKVHSRIDVDKSGESIWFSQPAITDEIHLAGNFAVFHSLKTGAIYERDLSTGMLHGPLKSDLSGNRAFGITSLAPNGAVLSYEGLAVNRHTGRRRSSYFANPSASLAPTNLNPRRAYFFCGSQIVGGDLNELRLIDPVTWLPVGIWGKRSSLLNFAGCDATHVYHFRYTETKTLVWTEPLPSS